VGRAFAITSLANFASPEPRHRTHLTDHPPPHSPLRSGADAAHFLQGLTTNDTRPLATAPHAAAFTAFLNTKGRTLYEAIMTSTSTHTAAAAATSATSVLLDVDRDQAAEVATHLKRYKLRAKVDVVDCSQSHAVWAVLPTDPFSPAFGTGPHGSEADKLLAHLRAAAASAPPSASFTGSAVVDPRARRLGLRLVLPASVRLDAAQLPLGDAADYAVLRMLLGVPEGREVVDTVPLEWNMPLLHGCRL